MTAQKVIHTSDQFQNMLLEQPGLFCRRQEGAGTCPTTLLGRKCRCSRNNQQLVSGAGVRPEHKYVAIQIHQYHFLQVAIFF